MKLGILGYGVVGSGLINMIDKDSKDRGIEIKGILVKDKRKHIDKKHYEKITEDIEDIFSEDIDTLVELIGDEENAYKYIKRALENGINVVTANKAVIADYGDELINIAREKGVSLRFEASVAGGVPVIKVLSEAMSGNQIKSINAILNGTTNFILSKMHDEKLEYKDALKKAQEVGFAEADPSADVFGYDAARKLAILSNIAFEKRVNWKDLYICGIDKVSALDIDSASELGCRIKLICHSEVENGKVSGYVRPAAVETGNPLSGIVNENNLVEICGDSVGKIALVGKGAGSFATGSAVYSDVTDIIENPGSNLSEISDEITNVYKNPEKKEDFIVRYPVESYEVVENILSDNNLIFRKILSKYGDISVFIEKVTEKKLDEIDEYLKNTGFQKSSIRIIKID